MNLSTSNSPALSPLESVAKDMKCSSLNLSELGQDEERERERVGGREGARQEERGRGLEGGEVRELKR